MSDNLKDTKDAFKKWAIESCTFTDGDFAYGTSDVKLGLKIWEAATSCILAEQQAAHDAEIARLKEEMLADVADRNGTIGSLQRMLSEANAACAMKAEALTDILSYCAGREDTETVSVKPIRCIAKDAHFASPQQVSEWEAKKLSEAEQRGAVKALEGQWITDSARPEYGEYVMVMTTDCDNDPLAVAAHFNGKNIYLGVGGKKISPVLGWMRIPELRATSKKAG